jgi:hypothetical protein
MHQVCRDKKRGGRRTRRVAFHCSVRVCSVVLVCTLYVDIVQTLILADRLGPSSSRRLL